MDDIGPAFSVVMSQEGVFWRIDTNGNHLYSRFSVPVAVAGGRRVRKAAANKTAAVIVEDTG